jgi:outer membrane biogenesis lipoprotein LolB
VVLEGDLSRVETEMFELVGMEIKLDCLSTWVRSEWVSLAFVDFQL